MSIYSSVRNWTADEETRIDPEQNDEIGRVECEATVAASSICQCSTETREPRVVAVNELFATKNRFRRILGSDQTVLLSGSEEKVERAGKSIRVSSLPMTQSIPLATQ